MKAVKTFFLASALYLQGCCEYTPPILSSAEAKEKGVFVRAYDVLVEPDSMVVIKEAWAVQTDTNNEQPHRYEVCFTLDERKSILNSDGYGRVWDCSHSPSLNMSGIQCAGACLHSFSTQANTLPDTASLFLFHKQVGLLDSIYPIAQIFFRARL